MTDDPVEILQAFFDSRMENIHTVIPGEIVKYEGHSQRKASVKPLVNLITRGGNSISLPVIDNVPVVFPGSGEFCLLFPLKRGDKCLILFAETGIGNYLSSSGKDTDADDISRFSLTDAMCIPGLWPFRQVPVSPAIIEITSAGNIEIDNNNTFININKDGNIEINGKNDNAIRYTGYDTDIQNISTQINANLSLIATAIINLGGSYVPSPIIMITTASKVNEVKLP